MNETTTIVIDKNTRDILSVIKNKRELKSYDKTIKILMMEALGQKDYEYIIKMMERDTPKEKFKRYMGIK